MDGHTLTLQSWKPVFTDDEAFESYPINIARCFESSSSFSIDIYPKSIVTVIVDFVR